MAKIRKIFKSGVFGIILGIILGILLAPKRCKKIREKLVKQFKKIKKGGLYRIKKVSKGKSDVKDKIKNNTEKNKKII